MYSALFPWLRTHLGGLDSRLLANISEDPWPAAYRLTIWLREDFISWIFLCDLSIETFRCVGFLKWESIDLASICQYKGYFM